MKFERTKNIVALLLFALFISMKLMGLHELTHSDDDNHPEYCYVCDFAKANDTIPVLLSPVTEFQIVAVSPTIEVQQSIEFQSIVCTEDIPTYLFSRPPPKA